MNDNDNNASMDETARNNASLPELPFLVTHWLHNYQGPEAGEGNREREEAIDRLRNATSEMAAAFSSLGAYGTSSRVCYTRDDYIFLLLFLHRITYLSLFTFLAVVSTDGHGSFTQCHVW